MQAALYRFADNIPPWVAVPFRAVFFTIALVCFGIYIVIGSIACGLCWWWDQVKG